MAMESKNLTGQIPPEDDLTEVKKPTSLLIAQFFLFPLIIIAICVGIFLLFGYLTYERRDPHEYLAEVKSRSGSGPLEQTLRWQAAYELSNIIAAEKDRVRSDNKFIEDLIGVYRGTQGQDPRVRQYLALTIGTLGDRRAVPALVEGLADNQPESQIYSLFALGTIGDNAAVPDVLKQLRNEDPAVRKVAAYVLGSFKDPRAAHDLQVALNDVKNQVRWNAAMALAQMNDTSGAEVLMQLIDRSYVNQLADMTTAQKNLLVMNAVKCLGILKFQPAHAKILALSQNDPDLGVRDASLEALKNFQM